MGLGDVDEKNEFSIRSRLVGECVGRHALLIVKTISTSRRDVTKDANAH